tara:strand:- start:588 stop:818 length:231 start_codon:yes stop_codon:yes gene_type:complete
MKRQDTILADKFLVFVEDDIFKAIRRSRNDVHGFQTCLDGIGMPARRMSHVLRSLQPIGFEQLVKKQKILDVTVDV